MGWRYQETVLTLCTVAFFITMVGRLAISPLVPDITADLGMSNTLIGGALTLMWVTYAVVQFPSGVLADRFGERIVIVASVGGTGLSALVIAAAPSPAVFIVGTALLGATAGLHYTVATALLTRAYDELGTAIGLHNSGGPIAGVATPVVVAWVAVSYGWRPAIGLIAVLAIPVAALFRWRIRPTEPRNPERPMRSQFDLGEVVPLLSRPTVAFTSLVAVLFDFTWQAVASFLPTFFVQHHGYSQTLASNLFAAYFVAHGVLQVGVGAIADRLSRDFATILCALTGIAGVTILVVGAGVWWSLTGIVVLGFGMGWSAAVFPRFMDNLSEAERSSGFGLIRTAYMIVAASGSVVVGVLADAFDWTVSFGFLVALLCVVCGLFLLNRTLDLHY